jgi:outer membrane protein assembly factor BamB
MKKKELLLVSCLIFFSCNLFTEKKDEEGSTYNAKIAWNSGLYSNDSQSHTVYDDYVYFYERPPGYTQVNIYTLTKLDAKTGSLVWRSAMFSNIRFCQPVVVGGYVYVLFYPTNIIWCFDKETGEHTATVEVDIENQGLELESFVTVYQEYLYLSLWNFTREYFVRLDVNEIKQNGDPKSVQSPVPEVLWKPDNKYVVTAKPVIYNNTVFTGTYGTENKPVEVAGFDIDTKEMVFHISFGGPEDLDDNIPFPEMGILIANYSIFIHKDILYYLSWTISAWNLKTGKQIYRHIFTWDTPEPKWYHATNSLQPVYYKNKIYYTSGESYTPNSHRNINCIEAATGKLAWNAIAKNSESLQTNPIIAHGKLYVSQFSGLYVYNPENGKLIGVDRSFCGAGMGRNVLYNDYMICVRKDRNTGDGKLVAVYVGE